MSVLKQDSKDNFTQIPNEAIEDNEIKPIAFRLYCYLRSRPNNWKINNADIMRKLEIGSKNTIAKYFNQLINAGWITREPSKDQNMNFTGGYDYRIYQEKQNKNEVNEPFNMWDSQNLRNRKNCEFAKSGNLNNTNSNTNTDKNNNTDNKFSNENFDKKKAKGNFPTGELYTKAMDSYWNFYQELTGVKPKIDATQGSSLKKLLKNIGVMVEKKDEDSLSSYEEKILKTLEKLFDSWPLLDDFNQRQLELRQINGNLNNLVYQIRSRKNDKNLRNSSEEFRKFLNL